VDSAPESLLALRSQHAIANYGRIISAANRNP
jgi:hypothetical protein